MFCKQIQELLQNSKNEIMKRIEAKNEIVLHEIKCPRIQMLEIPMPSLTPRQLDKVVLSSGWVVSEI